MLCTSNMINASTAFTLYTFFSLITLVASHSHVSSIRIGGQTYPGYPSDNPNGAPPFSIAWTVNVPNNGFVRDYSNINMNCHIDARPGNTAATVAAGSVVEFQWVTWPAHQGPVVDYMARCPGDCQTVDKTQLRWFKIAELGLLSLTGCNEKQTTGCWAIDTMRKQGDKWSVTVPKELMPGNYVIRTEPINLDFPQQSQNYPACINVVVTGSGTWQPDGLPGTQLYTGAEPGLNFDIYNMKVMDYKIPGPPVVVAPSVAPVVSSSTLRSVFTSSSPAPVTISSTLRPVTTPSTVRPVSTTTGLPPRTRAGRAIPFGRRA